MKKAMFKTAALAAVVIMMAACGSGAGKKAAVSDVDSTAVSAVDSAAVDSVAVDSVVVAK